MLLTIDIGNTNIVIGVYQGPTLIGHWRLSSTITRTSDESWIITRLLFESAQIQDSQISGIAISSVVPGLTDVFIQMAQKNFAIDPVVVSSELDTGIKILYQTPNTVGADRICNAVGGFAKYGGPLIVVDLGTATTFDIVTRNAEYLGGIIFPGLEMSASFLHHRTARLPKVALTFPEKIIGTSTTESIQSGLMYGSVEMIDGLVRRVMAERQEKMQVVATGGLAPVIQKKSTELKIIDPFLTLDGLRLIYERVSAASRPAV